MTVLAVVKVSKEFRITLPMEIREFLKVTDGSNLLFFTIESMKGMRYVKRGQASYL